MEGLFTEFEMKDLRNLKYFLGIEVLRSPKGIFICQKKYILDLLAEIGMINCKPADTPMMVAHMNAALRIIRYLKGTAGHGVLFRSNGHLNIQMYTDADWVGDNENRRSTSGYVSLVGEKLEAGIIELPFVKSSDQLADILTKAVALSKARKDDERHQESRQDRPDQIMLQHYLFAGTSNTAADGLSRSLNLAISTSQANIVEAIIVDLSDSASVSSLISEFQKDPTTMSDYHVKDGFLYRKNRLVIPPESRDLITLHPVGLLSPLPIPNQIWVDIAMDFITGLPNSRGYTVIMVVIDRLSKYAHFAPLSHIFKLQGTSLNMSSAYHPQSDGQSEALNKCLEFYLRCYVFDRPKAWVTFLPWAEFRYNSAFQTSIGVTPFKVVYGRDPPSFITHSFSDDTHPDVVQQLKERDFALAQLKVNLTHAQARMKKYADQKRRDLNFSVGDFILVKLQPYRQLSVKLHKNQKLRMCYFGPFQIIQKVGLVAYKLELPSTSRIHPVFHVSFLKPCVGDPSEQYIPLPLLSISEGPLVQPL
nr:hypothetical protein [Tanacetum cinerariifolium]